MTPGMRFAALAAAMVTFASVQGAEAATPKVAGTYATTGWHICQLVITTPKSAVSKVTGALTQQAVTDIFSSTNSFVSAVNPQNDTFVRDVNFGGQSTTTGPGIASVSPTTNSAIVDVGPTSRIDFVTQVQTANVSAVTSVEPVWTSGKGIISMTVGTVTFPAAASSSGSVKMSTVEVLGHAMRNDNPANNVGFTRNTSSGTGTFSFPTAATLKIGTTVYDISVGDVDANGVARVIHALRRPNANEYCIDSTTLTKQ